MNGANSDNACGTGLEAALGAANAANATGSHLEAALGGANAANATGSHLEALVVESLTYLGMAQHAERLLRLLRQAGIHTLEQVSHLSQEQCTNLHLPFDLISGMQKRIAVWKIELKDASGVEFDRGIATACVFPTNVSRSASSQPQCLQNQAVANMLDEHRLNRLQDLLTQGLQRVDDHVRALGLTLRTNVDRLQEQILTRQPKPDTEMCERVKRIDDHVGTFAQKLQSNLDTFQEQLPKQRAKPEAEVFERLKKLEDRLNTVAQALQANLDGLTEQLVRNLLKPEEFKTEFSRSMQGWMDKLQHACEQQSVAETSRASQMEGQLQLMAKRCELAAEGVDRSLQGKIDQLQDMVRRVQASTDRHESATAQTSVTADRSVQLRMERMEDSVRSMSSRFDRAVQAAHTYQGHDPYDGNFKKDLHHALMNANSGGINSVVGMTKWSTELHGGNDAGYAVRSGDEPYAAAVNLSDSRYTSSRGGSRPQSALRNGGSRTYRDGPAAGGSFGYRADEAVAFPSLSLDVRHQKEGHVVHESARRSAVQAASG
eukprot:TRINITY_DN5907_c0_g1_i1.p1 TRINITY_DN5907_c0_g1~~TRINITY_DN5907_c0_g1_i1.p1  ORF type:complete len:566 (-),score=118.35 TRINITY_DN5907_c0_g1_i1:59-1696(-)